MSIRIRIEHGQDAGKTLRLGRPGVYVLGRHPSASMRVLDMKVSKAHCEVHVGDNGTSAMLRDLNSTHGSQVNGQPVSSDTGLNPGDELRLGLTILRVLSDGDADEEIEPTQGRNLDAAGVENTSSTNRTRGVDTSSAQKLPPDELVGKELGGYKIEQKIGKGGMGAVYLAEQVSLKRKVALKVLSEKFVKDSAFVDQFLNEARSAGALNHPNVVQVYDVGSEGGHYFFSMEFVSGGSIEEILDKQPGDWKEALNWFLDATNALVFANKRDILHRDVKPDNLMVSEDGSAKLCDLGLAKRSENDDLMSQGIIGTPHFISPEAIRRKTTIDHRTDLYSLGCTFFRVLSGKNPFPGKTVKEILLGHLNKPVPHVNDHAKSVPQALDAIVHKLMAKDPDERYQTPEELLVALDKVRLQHGLEEHGIKPKSRKPIIIAAAVLLAAAIGVIAMLMSKPAEIQEVDRTKDMSAVEERVKVTQLITGVSTYLNNATSDKLELDTRRTKSDISETWEQDEKSHLKLAADYGAKAKVWRDKIKEWKGSKAKAQPKIADWEKRENAPDIDALIAEFGKLLKAYDDGSTKLQGYASAGDKAAQDIRDYIKTRKELKSETETKHDEAVAAIDKKLKEFAGELDRLLAEGAYMDLEEKLAENAVTELLADIVDNAFLEHPLIGKVQLLRQPTADKPGEVEVLIKGVLGDPPGKKWRDAALKKMGEAFKKAWDDATQALKDNAKAPPSDDGGVPKNPKNTHEGYDAALKILRDYLDSLPSDRGGTGPIAKKFNEWRDAISVRITRLERDKKLLEDADWRHDQAVYFRLLVDLRHPPTGYDDINIGLFHLIDGTVLPSVAGQTSQIAANMRTDAYRELAETWARDAKALDALLQHLKASFDKGWSRKVVELDGEKDKVEKKKPRAVSLSGIQFGRDEETTFRELGPKVLIERVFYYKGEPRFEFTKDDLRGLGILAELAGDRGAAEKHYIAYKTKLSRDDADEIADVSRRLNSLDAEMQVAAAWYRAHEVEQEFNEFLEQVDPRLIGVKNFGNAQRQKILEEFNRFNALLFEVNDLVDKMVSDPNWASTAWGSAIRRESKHPDVAYANEKVPPLKKRAPPAPAPNANANAGENPPAPVNPAGKPDPDK